MMIFKYKTSVIINSNTKDKLYINIFYDLFQAFPRGFIILK